jgi:hypothetical protein
MEGSCVSRLANFVGFDMDRLRQPEKGRQDADQNSGPIGFLKPRASLFKYRKQTHLAPTLHRLTEFGHTTYGGEIALAIAMALARLLVYLEILISVNSAVANDSTFCVNQVKLAPFLVLIL